MRTPGKLVVAVALVGLVAGCSSGGSGVVKTIDLNAQGMTYDQKEITVNKGETVKLVFHNQDSLLHDFSIDKIPAKVGESQEGGHHDMGMKMPDVHTSADAGKTGEVEFTPSKAGTYTFYCTVPGHKDAGMQGTLIVK